MLVQYHVLSAEYKSIGSVTPRSLPSGQ